MKKIYSDISRERALKLRTSIRRRRLKLYATSIKIKAIKAHIPSPHRARITYPPVKMTAPDDSFVDVPERTFDRLMTERRREFFPGDRLVAIDIQHDFVGPLLGRAFDMLGVLGLYEIHPPQEVIGEVISEDPHGE